MSILSDITIRELCQPQFQTLEECISFVKIQEDSKRVREECETRLLTAFGVSGKFHTVEHTPAELQVAAEKLYRDRAQPMIEPFHPGLVREVDYPFGHFQYGQIESVELKGSELIKAYHKRKIISKGTTSYGYDVSLTDDVRVFTNTNATEIDPKRFDEQKCLAKAEIRTDEDGGRYVLIPPHSYMLGSTVEYFRIPRDIMVVCVGKSTYARSGAIVNTTPIEPGFEGNVVIEIANTAPLPCRIYLDEGIAQFMFFRGDKPCETSYGDRGGKYMMQTGVTPPKV